jgi:hypothetical protein
LIQAWRAAQSLIEELTIGFSRVNSKAMKRFPLFALMMLGLGLAVDAQDNTATLLKGPADWRFEHIPIPPQFAPTIKYTGYEEARFAPGMFSNQSTNYFTYALVVSVDGTPELGAVELKNFLEEYYQGLSMMVGRRKQLTPDRKLMSAVVTAAKSPSGEGNQFEAKLPFFDSFTDGRKIVLNMEIRVVAKPASKKSFILLLISPRGPDGEVWKKLREIGGTVKFE